MNLFMFGREGASTPTPSANQLPRTEGGGNFQGTFSASYRMILRDCYPNSVPALLYVYDGVVKIDLSNHARRRLREKNLTVEDLRNVLANHARAHPSPRKRMEKGRTISGERINVVYTEVKADEFRIVSVITPDRR